MEMNQEQAKSEGPVRERSAGPAQAMTQFQAAAMNLERLMYEREASS